MNNVILLLLLLAPFARADDSIIWLPNLGAYATGTSGAGKNSLDVNITGGSITANNPSVGPTASPAPTQATYIGAVDGSGNLVGVKTGIQTAPNSLAVVPAPNPSGSFSQSAVVGSSAAVTMTKPANAVAFVIEASSSNTPNLRYAIGSAATTSSGMRLEPGRSEFYPLAANISVIAESSTNQEVEVQWVLSQ